MPFKVRCLSVGRFAVLSASLVFGACASVAEEELCFFVFKNVEHYNDDNFNAIGDKTWAEHPKSRIGFHHSGYHLFIEAGCGIKSMQDLTSYFGIPYVEGNEYEIFDITEEDFKKYRSGLLAYP